MFYGQSRDEGIILSLVLKPEHCQLGPAPLLSKLGSVINVECHLPAWVCLSFGVDCVPAQPVHEGFSLQRFQAAVKGEFVLRGVANDAQVHRAN